MKSRRFAHLICAAAAVAGMVLVAPAAWAQASAGAHNSGGQNATDADANNEALEEIVVTARRRDENEERVPITVTASSGTGQASGSQAGGDRDFQQG